MGIQKKNVSYRSIIDRHSGNQSRIPEVVMGSLIEGSDLEII
jgi:hypothetical protein